MKKQIIFSIFLFYILFLTIVSLVTEKENRVMDNSCLYKKKEIQFAAFFPTTSPFSRSRIKNRMSQKTLLRKIQINNQSYYQQFIKKTENLIKLLHEINTGNNHYHEVLIYWQFGEQIIMEMALHNNQAYHTFLINSLTDELGIPQQKLNTIIALRKAYPVAAELPLALSWEHCEILIEINEKDKRLFYQRITEKNQWTPNELRQNIQKNIDIKTQ
ncbi:MAG: hypothetical protein C0403_05205 [Desulfobacterium sp.]|nr:hypothetical protein [Desulfobacterium sp.]